MVATMSSIETGDSCRIQEVEARPATAMRLRRARSEAFRGHRAGLTVPAEANSPDGLMRTPKAPGNHVAQRARQSGT